MQNKKYIGITVAIIALASIIIGIRVFLLTPPVPPVPNNQNNPASDWITIDLASTSSRIQMPPPQHFGQVGEDQNQEPIYQDRYVAENPSSTFYYAFTTVYPKPISIKDIPATLNEMLKNMVGRDTNITIRTSKLGTFASLPALEFEIANSADNATYRGRIFYTKSTLYQIYISHPEKDNRTDEYQRFFNSFQLTAP